MASQRSLPRQSKPKLAIECSFRLERESGFTKVAGVDEVGRGCLAGPVVAAAVLFPREIWFSNEPWLAEVDDSKKLKSEKRQEIAQKIRESATAVEIGVCSPEEIDKINILQATFKAARFAIAAMEQKMATPLELILMDGSHKISQISTRQHPVIEGDRISKSIAAASIVAKVFRDQWMEKIAGDYPHFGFEKHKGYGTKEHLIALRNQGPTSLHRRSFLKKFEAVAHGREAENSAADFLKQAGFDLINRNWKTSGAEIDLIAKKDRELHFFEVRFRSQSVDLPLVFPFSKQAQFKKAVELYLLRNPEYSKASYHLHFLSVSTGNKIVPFWDVFKF